MNSTTRAHLRPDAEDDAGILPDRPVGRDSAPGVGGAGLTHRAEYRAVRRDLPDREPFASLSPNGKLLLLTVKLTLGPSGIELLPPKRFHATFEERTSLPPARLRSAIRELRRAKCLDIEGSVVWCVRQLADDPLFHSGNPRHRTKIRRDVAKLPDLAIVRRYRQTYAEWFIDGERFTDG